MNYIGIDPSTKTGLVILNQNGNIKLEIEIKSKIKQDPQRFMDIADQIIKLINKTCKGEEVKILIEGFSFGSRGKAVSTQYGIGWVIRTLLVESLLEYTEVSPSALKKFATGKGNCKKEDMILPIYKRWGYQNDSDNIRDAYVLAQIGRYLDGHAEPTKFQEEVLNKLRGE